VILLVEQANIELPYRIVGYGGEAGGIVVVGRVAFRVGRNIYQDAGTILRILLPEFFDPSRVRWADFDRGGTSFQSGPRRGEESVRDLHLLPGAIVVVVLPISLDQRRPQDEFREFQGLKWVGCKEPNGLRIELVTRELEYTFFVKPGVRMMREVGSGELKDQKLRRCVVLQIAVEGKGTDNGERRVGLGDIACTQ